MKDSNDDSDYGINAAWADRIAHIPWIFLLNNDTGQENGPFEFNIFAGDSSK
jgi:hypothetical protein